ncbi:piezo-type mechanosensitive ion channel homolog [Fagus crenata]
MREQEKKAAWKTAQLQHIRESEEKKRQRNLQVEKMKSEMLNLQIQLHSMNSTANYDGTSPLREGLMRRRRRSTSITSNNDAGTPDKEELNLRKQEQIIREESVFPSELHESPGGMNAESPSVAEFTKQMVGSSHCEISEVESDVLDMQMIGDGVSQVQSIGNQAVNNLVSSLNIQEDTNVKESLFAEDGEPKNRVLVCGALFIFAV